MGAAGQVLRAATRGSPLARWQTTHVGLLLAPRGITVEPVVIETLGDKKADVALSAFGGQGVFVKEVQAAVLDGRADFAVHSAKDLPSTTAEGLCLAAVPERGDPRDALVGATLDTLATGARVATGAVRRRAQMANLRSDLTFAEVRGNIATRLSRLADSSLGIDAIVMAVAALERLGLEDRIGESLAVNEFVPQAGQGALALEARAGDTAVLDALAAIQHRPSRIAVDAERSFLAELGGGCSLPAGAYATVADDEIHLMAMIAASHGGILLRHAVQGPTGQPEVVGRAAAAYLLDDAGGRALLEGR